MLATFKISTARYVFYFASTQKYLLNKYLITHCGALTEINNVLTCKTKLWSSVCLKQKQLYAIWIHWFSRFVCAMSGGGIMFLCKLKKNEKDSCSPELVFFSEVWALLLPCCRNTSLPLLISYLVFEVLIKNHYLPSKRVIVLETFSFQLLAFDDCYPCTCSRALLAFRPHAVQLAFSSKESPLTASDFPEQQCFFFMSVTAAKG